MPPENVGALEAVPFARSRALRLIGAALLGAALRLTAPELARATDQPAWPCSGSLLCHCCEGSTCCEKPCTVTTASCQGGTAQCWYVCTSTGDVYRCCDWLNPSGKLCICPEWVPITC